MVYRKYLECMGFKSYLWFSCGAIDSTYGMALGGKWYIIRREVVYNMDILIVNSMWLVVVVPICIQIIMDYYGYILIICL